MREVAQQALRATELQAPLLAAGSAVAYFAGPVFLGAILPWYSEGLPALRPLLPGVTLLGLAWPARQMLITIGRPYRLAVATLVGLAMSGIAGVIGADRAGIVGVAWGMTAGYAAVFLLSSATAFVPCLGLREWFIHLVRLAAAMGWVFAGAVCAASLSTGLGAWPDLGIQLPALVIWFLPPVALWSWHRGWLTFDHAR